MIDLNEKIIELAERTKLTPYIFCKKFDIRFTTFKKWKSRKVVPSLYVPAMIEMVLDLEDTFGLINISEDYENVAEELKSLRREAGLRQTDMRARFFLSCDTYSSWEQGLHKPPNYAVRLLKLILTYEKRFDAYVYPHDWAYEYEKHIDEHQTREIPQSKLQQRVEHLIRRSGLSDEMFCNKYKLNQSWLRLWRTDHEPKLCIPYLIERLMDYEEKYGVLKARTGISSSIRILRERSGLSQKRFCWKFRIKLASLHNWEHGRSKPSTCILYMIERILDYENECGFIEPDRWWVKEFDFTV